MNQGEVEYAERRALELFYKWNDVTGFPEPGSSYFSEIESCIEDAVHVGIQMALHGKIRLNKDGELVKGDYFKNGKMRKIENRTGVKI